MTLHEYQPRLNQGQPNPYQRHPSHAGVGSSMGINLSSGMEAAVIYALSLLQKILCDVNNQELQQYRKMAESNEKTALFTAKSTIDLGVDRFNEYLAQGLGGLVGGVASFATMGRGYLKDPYEPQLKGIEEEKQGIELYQKAVEDQLKQINPEIIDSTAHLPAAARENVSLNENVQEQTAREANLRNNNAVEETHQPHDILPENEQRFESIEMQNMSGRNLEAQEEEQVQGAEVNRQNVGEDEENEQFFDAQDHLDHPYVDENEEEFFDAQDHFDNSDQEQQGTIEQTRTIRTEIENKLRQFESPRFPYKNGKPHQVTEKYDEHALYTDKELLEGMRKDELKGINSRLNFYKNELQNKKDALLHQQSSHHSSVSQIGQSLNGVFSNSGSVGASIARKASGEDEAKSQLSNASSQGMQGMMSQLLKIANDAIQQAQQFIQTFATISSGNRFQG